MTGEIVSPKDMLARLIAFDTVSRHSNRALIDFVADYLRGHGIEAELVPSDDGAKANLFALIGPREPGGIVLSGHTDVVPTDGQPWDTDPFELVERDGLLYGRGTADMKGFVALALALVPEFKARVLSRPIVLALSYDEEVGCLGAPRLIETMLDRVPRPELVVIGEPTTMKPINAHKGIRGMRFTVRGREAHSSIPTLGANAILHATRLIAFIERLQEEEKTAADPASRFDPPWSTFNVGRIDGGTALNIVARDCTVLCDFRAVPGTDEEAVMAKLHRHIDEVARPALLAECPDGAIELETLAAVPGLMPERHGAAETLARQLSGANEAGVVPFGTEGGLFQAAGLSTIVIGPGDIAQAHQTNEHLSLDQFAAGETFLRRLADWATA